MHGSGAGPAALGARRRPWGGEKGEGAAVVRFPHLIWAEALRGNLAMAASGGDRGGGAARLGGDRG